MTKYKQPYHEYTDGTDVGADALLLSPESQAVVAKGKALYQKGYETGDQGLMDQGHAMAEGERLRAGYSGGANGGAYNPLADGREKGSHASATHMSASPTWTPRFQAQQDAAVQQLQQRAPFSYDPEKDPAYQQYKEQYTRAGKRAADDSLATTLARTGGEWNSTASIVAQQANEAYMQQLADKVPELRQLAYQMWRDEGDQLRSDAQMYGALDSQDAGIWAQTVLNPFQADRDYARQVDNELYDRGLSEREWGLKERMYQDERDDVAYERSETEKAKQEQEAKEYAALLADRAGDYSGYQGVYGQLTPEQVAALQGIYDEDRDYQHKSRELDLAAQQLGVDLSRKQLEEYGKSSGGGGYGGRPSDDEQQAKEASPQNIASIKTDISVAAKTGESIQHLLNMVWDSGQYSDDQKKEILNYAKALGYDT